MGANHFKVNRGVTLNSQASAPSSPVDGDLYYDTTNFFQFRQNGAWVSIGAAAGTSNATASTLMSRDANANTRLNSLIENFTTTATAAGTTTLTVGSTYKQQFTGTTTQTVVLPDATTLVVGQSFMIMNRSTGVVTVNKNGGTLVQTMAAGSQTIVTVTAIGTAAGSWDSAYSLTSSGGSTSPLTTKGDVWGYSTVDARIPVGTNGQVLTADSTQTLGLKWAESSDTTSAAYTINTQSGTTYTFALTDGSNNGNSPLVKFTSASSVTATVPPNSSVAFPTGSQIDITQDGAGLLSISPGSGVTINSLNGSTVLKGQYTRVTLLKTGTNTWTLAGTLADVIAATGGTITTDGNFKVHTFTSSGTFQITGGAGLLDTLVIAGGGGGGNNEAGGGGAGGYKYTTALPYGVGSYTVTVGAGGAGGTGTNNGTSGSNSVFDTITSTGGGGGGDATKNGLSGGSGGGGGGNNAPGTGGAASPSGQGNAGGNGFSSNSPNSVTGGGGGGAGAAGANGASLQAGNGGAGLADSITGSSVTRAGGGGGGGASVFSDNPGTGGSGGGGNGSSSGVGSNGTANTGGGGGGGGNPFNGGNGGSGVVIVRYRFQ